MEPNGKNPIRESRERLEPKEQGTAFESRGNWRGLRRDGMTFINLDALPRRYRLEHAYAVVKELEFVAPKDLRLEVYTDYLKLRDKLKFREELDAQLQERPSAGPDESYLDTYASRHFPKGKMLVLVDSNVYASVKASIDIYVIDLARDGYWADVYVVTGGTPPMLRAFLQEKSPIGAVLVGSIVVAWYDHEGDQFPCDLYYMDLDGTWSDPNGDGKFEEHTGDVGPEIWISRIYTPTADGNDADLINDFFARNHKYRNGQLGHARSALSYVDDDWTGFADCGFLNMFDSSVVTTYTTPIQTDVDLYKAEIQSRRAWAQVCAHSWTQGHALRVDTVNEYVDTPYFRDVNPPNAHFYNLFACGPGRFTSADYLAGWYLFDKAAGGTNAGQTVVASAKTGSMLFFEDFYTPMGAGKVIGDAYVDWWNARGGTHEDWERYWFYGLVLLGDPTINWWNGVVPQKALPENDDRFDHWPRKMQFRWDPVGVAGASYTIEVDAFGAVNGGQWAAASNSTFLTQSGIAGTTYDHSFVGAQRGRWRVRATVASRQCSWSDWSYFRFTV